MFRFPSNKTFWIYVSSIAVFAIAIFAGINFYKKSYVAITNFPPKNETIIAFGDSLVAGNGASNGHDFVSNLSALIGLPIINAGVPGNTTQDGLNRLTEITDQVPGVVLVVLGGNDFLKRVPKETTFVNLEAIVRRLQLHGAVVIVVGERGGLISDAYESSYREVAKKTGALYVTNILDGLIGNKSVMSDEIHPNDAGYVLVAQKIYPVLRQALEK